MARLITVAIHTYQKALALKSLLEAEGIPVILANVNLEQPEVSSGLRVRISESDLPLALRIIENRDVFEAETYTESKENHRILIPVDFSPCSIEAVKTAAFIAQKRGLNMTLLNTFIDPYMAGNMQLGESLSVEIADSEARIRLEATSKKEMEKFADKIRAMMKKAEMPVVKFSTQIDEGVPEDVITAYVKANHPYIVVMGTRGADRKEREMIGSVTAEVIDHAASSVLTVPEKVSAETLTNISRVLFFATVSQDDILAMDTLHRVFPDLKAKISVIVVRQRNKSLFSDKNINKRVDSLLAYFIKCYPASEFQYADLSEPKGDEDFGKLSDKYDILVVPNKRKSAFSRMLSPSLSHKLIFSADVPMLVIPV